MAGSVNHMNRAAYHVAEAAPALPPAGEDRFARMSAVLLAPIRTEIDTVRLAEAGVSAAGYRQAAKVLGFPHSLIAPETTVRRRLKENAHFSEAESERLIRLARIYAEAVELFGHEAAALEWLNTPQPFIPGEPAISPLWLAAKDSGARLVEALMRRTAYGIF